MHLTVTATVQQKKQSVYKYLYQQIEKAVAPNTHPKVQ